MIGVYNYTVILTYLSLMSGATGIFVYLFRDTDIHISEYSSFTFRDFCAAFDGKVARSKKNRTKLEKDFGVQIDSLADLVSFGVLPACIGMAMLRVSERYSALRFINELTRKVSWYSIALTIIAALYVLAALIRLAYFNATEEERAEEMAKTGSMHYTGLPVTSAALIFPFVVLVHFFTKFDFSLLYFFVLLLVGILFVCPFKLKKLGGKALYVLVAIGIIEFILLIWFKWRH